MANPTLRILQPAHGARIAGSGNVRLQGEVSSGGAAGLFFKWYSTLNPAATATAPELNATDHTAAKLDWTTPLDVGTHVLTLAAADREGSDLPSIQAVTRSGFAGGKAAPGNTSPCVVHRLWAILKTPATDGTSMSKALATIEMRAPARWGKQSSPGVYVKDADYHEVNGLQYRFHFAPFGVNDPARTAELVPSVDAFTFFIDGGDNKPYLRWRGALPGNLGNGAYVLTLFVESLDRAVNDSVARRVTLTA